MAKKMPTLSVPGASQMLQIDQVCARLVRPGSSAALPSHCAVFQPIDILLDHLFVQSKIMAHHSCHSQTQADRWRCLSRTKFHRKSRLDLSKSHQIRLGLENSLD